MAFKDFAKNKKTYAAMAVGIILGAIQGLDAANITAIHIPTWVNWIIAFAGLSALRSGVQTNTAQVTQDIANLVTLVLGQLRAPTEAEVKVAEVVQTSAYHHASEEEQTDMLNASQLPKEPK